MNNLIDFGVDFRARVRSGTDGAVLWVHGYTINSSMWLPLWARLPGWQHIGVDLPGHGYSKPLSRHHDLASLGRALGQAALDHGVRHVIGLSLGSMVALQIVQEFPMQFASLILGAPAIGGGPTDPAVGLRYRELVGLYHERGPGPWMTDLWMKSPPNVFTFALRDPTLSTRLRRVIDSHRWDELEGSSIVNLARFRQPLERLKEITASTQILVGDYELPAFRQSAEILQKAIPRCQVTYLRDTGHLCMLESVEQSAEMICMHLKNVGLE